MAEPTLTVKSDRYKRPIGRSFCAKCGSHKRSDRKSPNCKACDSICECGKPKDFRAFGCVSCGRKRNAVKQWSNPDTRETIHAGIIKAHRENPRQRRMFSDLMEEHFAPRKDDGRFVATYFTNSGVQRIYRYRWRWLKSGKRIPAGMQLHHKDGDQTNDDLSNLQLVTATEHRRIHVAKNRARLSGSCTHQISS